MTTAVTIPAERRRVLASQIESFKDSVQTDAAEFRRLLRSYLRRPQLVYLRELLRTGPARRSPETEAAWKGLRQALLPLLEKGEVTETELPWFLAWAARTTVSRPLAIERPQYTDRSRFRDNNRPGQDAGHGPGGPRGERRPFGGSPGGSAPRGGPRDGGPRGRHDGRGDRMDQRGPVRMPQQPREVDSRWEQLKNFRFDEESKDKK